MKISQPNRLFAILSLLVLSIGYSSIAHSDSDADHIALTSFQVPEVVPNITVNEPEKIEDSTAILVRSDNAIHAIISTNHLPAGVYTFWWELAHPDGTTSILWATSQIVTGDGKAALSASLLEGEENAPGNILTGQGLLPGTAATVEVEFWVRLHGDLSDDPQIAYEQQTKPFGGCTDVRNPTPRLTDFPCWNPQRAVFTENDDDNESEDESH